MSKDDLGQIALLYEFVHDLELKGAKVEVLNEWVMKHPELRQQLGDLFHDEVRSEVLPSIGGDTETSDAIGQVKAAGVSTLQRILIDRNLARSKRA